MPNGPCGGRTQMPLGIWQRHRPQNDPQVSGKVHAWAAGGWRLVQFLRRQLLDKKSKPGPQDEPVRPTSPSRRVLPVSQASQSSRPCFLAPATKIGQGKLGSFPHLRFASPSSLRIAIVVIMSPLWTKPQLYIWLYVTCLEINFS